MTKEMREKRNSVIFKNEYESGASFKEINKAVLNALKNDERLSEYEREMLALKPLAKTLKGLLNTGYDYEKNYINTSKSAYWTLKNGIYILTSYYTPLIIIDTKSSTIYVDCKKHSSTSSKHFSQLIADAKKGWYLTRSEAQKIAEKKGAFLGYTVIDIDRIEMNNINFFVNYEA